MDILLPILPSLLTRGPRVAIRLSIGISKKKAKVVEPPITTRATRRRPIAKKAPVKPLLKKAPVKPPTRRAPSEKTLGKRLEVLVGYLDDNTIDNDKEVPSPST